jgi:hypothetical protein
MWHDDMGRLYLLLPTFWALLIGLGGGLALQSFAMIAL